MKINVRQIFNSPKFEAVNGFNFAYCIGIKNIHFLVCYHYNTMRLVYNWESTKVYILHLRKEYSVESILMHNVGWLPPTRQASKILKRILIKIIAKKVNSKYVGKR